MSESKCTALLSLHAFTRCDSTSAFRGIGKVRPIKRLLATDKYDAALEKLGDSWDISDDLLTDLEEFTCAIYGRPKYKSGNSLRTDVLREKCGREKLDPKKNFIIGTLTPYNIFAELTTSLEYGSVHILLLQ